MGWIDKWLEQAEQEARTPPKPAVKHPNEPDHVVAIDADPAEVEALLTHIRSDLDSTGKAKVGRLGSFVVRGQRVGFDQGPALEAMFVGENLSGQDLLSRAFTAAADGGPWAGVEIPGLCRVWVRESKRDEFRDYLGRPSYFGRDGLFWTVVTLPTYPCPPGPDDEGS